MYILNNINNSANLKINNLTMTYEKYIDRKNNLNNNRYIMIY